MKPTALAGVVIAIAAISLSCRGVRTDERPQINPLGPNAGCYVCHIPFVREPLSTMHLKAEVGCVNCHGVSAAHANDEDIGATLPDITFKGEAVNRSCRVCHETHDIAPEKMIARWTELPPERRKPETPDAAVSCTVCHGHHKIARAAK